MNISNLADEIYKLLNAIREHIGTYSQRSDLLDSNALEKICSSLDAIEDSLCAVVSYDTNVFPQDIGLKYIYTYGILQALYLMQDAVKHLIQVLNISYKPSERLKQIRDLRNAIAHLTEHKKGEGYYCNFISRWSMEKSGFDLTRCTKDHQEKIHMDIVGAYSDQLQDIIDLCRQVLQKLEESDLMHKEKFKSDPLTNIFHYVNYFFGKIWEGISGDKELSHAHLCNLKKTYEKFKEALKDRKELNEQIESKLNDYFHGLDKLDKYFSGNDTQMEEKDARIYLSYLQYEHEYYFVEIAKEIDEEYGISGAFRCIYEKAEELLAGRVIKLLTSLFQPKR